MSIKMAYRAIAGAALCVALYACGGGSSVQTTVNQAGQTINKKTGDLMAAPVPADVRCGAVRPVWVTDATKVYREPGDVYYGRTKTGRYMCPSAAVKAGYHLPGQKPKMTSGRHG
jgi:hypothetical protein